jgi:acetyl esterase
MIDPELEPIVATVNSASDPAGDPSLEERRTGYLTFSTLGGSGPRLDHVEDRSIAGPGGDIPVRVYRNDGSSGIFVFFHGGGHTIGSLDSHDEPCRQIATRSAATVISIGYRLAPEHPFPAAVEDAWAAVLWADEHRLDLGGVSSAGIVVGGDSAGGNLAAVVALMARDEGIDLVGQALVYPAISFDDDSTSMNDNAEGYVLTRNTINWFTEQYAPDLGDWRANPGLADRHDGVAPALVVTAEYDPLRDQGAAYARQLAAAGVDVTLTDYAGAVHTFFQLGPLCASGARSVAQVGDFVRRRLA